VSENLIFFLVLIGGFAVGLGPVIFGRLRRARILKMGVPARARILAVKDTGRRHNRDPVVIIDLLVVDPARGELPGRVKMPVSPVRLPALQPGRHVSVRYLPGSPPVRVAIDPDSDMTGVP